MLHILALFNDLDMQVSTFQVSFQNREHVKADTTVVFTRLRKC